MDTNTMVSPVKIQDYIVNLSEDKSPSTTYEVVLENNTDFIISRRTLKTERELVILISQNLFYIKDKKTGAIDGITTASMMSFFRQLKDDVIELKNVNWLPVISKETVERIERVISDEVIADMCRHNVLNDVSDPEWYRGYWEKNSKLFMKLHSMFPTISDSAKYKASFPLIFELDRRFGYNEAIYFASQLVKSGIEKFSAEERYNNYGIYGTIGQGAGAFTKIINEPKYNLNLRRLIDYILFDLYKQGMADIGYSFWNDYKDYLEMQVNYYGKVIEKYPQYFQTMHDVMTLKINTVKAVEECKNFEDRAKEIEDLAYKGNKYSILIPTHPQELADEGINLSHCVKDYIGRVAKGECHILFMRRSSALKQSLVTLQLCGNTLCQAQGMKRRPITKEERNFLIRWGSEKNIEIAV